MKTGRMNQKGILSRRVKASRRGNSPKALTSLQPSQWRLPSGEGLAEFALHAGFVAPSLMAAGSARSSTDKSRRPDSAEHASEYTVRTGETQ